MLERLPGAPLRSRSSRNCESNSDAEHVLAKWGEDDGTNWTVELADLPASKKVGK